MRSLTFEGSAEKYGNTFLLNWKQCALYPLLCSFVCSLQVHVNVLCVLWCLCVGQCQHIPRPLEWLGDCYEKTLGQIINAAGNGCACSCWHLRILVPPWASSITVHEVWTLIFKFIPYCVVNFDIDLDLNAFL